MIVLVSGVPASGKKTYCEWLGREKSFLHLDFDRLLQGEGSSCRLDLVRKLQGPGASPRSFAQAVLKVGVPAVIDWGFPPQNLPLVEALQQEGAEVWWFHAERAVARRKFVGRGTLPIEPFELQMDRIEANWPQIEGVIGNRIVVTLKPDGSYVPPEVIYKWMFPSVER